MSTIPQNCVALTEQMVKLKTKVDRLGDVKSLNLWGQDLADVSLLNQMPAVEVLSLSVNNISSLKDFASCLKLQELYLRKNEIADVHEVSHLANLPELQVLWLSDNPCAQDPNYRAKVLQLLPQLHKLDNDDVANRTPIAAETFAPPAANTSAVQPAQTSPTQAQKPLSSTVSPAPDAVLSPNTAANEQPSFHPEKAAFISPSQLPTAVAPPSIEPAASMPPGRSNVLYAVIALLAELDVGSLHIVQAEVTVNRDAPS